MKRCTPARAWQGLACALLLACGSSASACALFDGMEGAAHGPQPPQIEGEAAHCTRFASLSGRPGLSCAWAFGLRDPQANLFAQGLWADLTQCRPGTPVAEEDGVNHPDSYGLRLWRTDAHRYGVSVKDKGAEGRTLVFLRLD